MKKIVIIVCLLILLNACESSGQTQKFSSAETYLNNINMKLNEDVIDDVFWLENDYPGIEWSSDNEAIKLEGYKAIVSKVKEDTNVTLTAKIGNVSKDFEFTVRAENDKTKLYRDVRSLKNDISYFLDEGTKLPDVLYNGSLVEWSIKKGEVKLDGNKIIKNNNDSNVEVVLTAIVSNGKEKETIDFEVVVLDEYKAYLMSYFNGELEEETAHFAISYDGLNWQDLNIDLSSTLGTGRVRDPFISRNKEDKFVILATEGFDNPNIYYWESEDLKTFENHKEISLAYLDEEIHLTGQRAWAPEFYYSQDEELYYIYFSDTGSEYADRIYYVTTKDFNEFSKVKTFLKTSYSMIDATIIENHGMYYMFYKDEREGLKTIYYAESYSLDSGFAKTYDNNFICDQKFIEGPFVFKKLDDSGYYLYVDYYSEGKFLVSEFSSLGLDNDITWLEEKDYNLPSSNTRHGSVVLITEKEAKVITGDR